MSGEEPGKEEHECVNWCETEIAMSVVVYEWEPTVPFLHLS